MEKIRLEQLLINENEQVQKLNDIVVRAIEEEKLLSQKVFEFEEKQLSFSGRFADSIASFGGSWAFILCFLGFIGAWIAVNLYLLSRPFDPFPFILLNLILSTIAAIQAPLILMSQNRKEEKDRKRAINDYVVNLKAEIEVRNLHQKLDLLMAEQMKTLFAIQGAQIDMMEEIKSELRSNRDKPTSGN